MSHDEKTGQKIAPKVTIHAQPDLRDEFVGVVVKGDDVKRKAPSPTPRLKVVLDAFQTFREHPTLANLKMLSVAVETWAKVDRFEFKRVGGSPFQDAITAGLASSPQEGPKPALKLENGDVLFRYVPHLAPGNTLVKVFCGQRGGMQGKISDGQSDLQGRLGKYRSDDKILQTTAEQTGLSKEQLQQIFDTSNAGHSADLIQHVGIYVNVAGFDGVVEIGLKGLYGNSMPDHGQKTIDLVVRFVQSDVAFRVGNNAYTAMETNWEFELYPMFADFKYMIDTPSTCGVLPKAKLQEVKKAQIEAHWTNYLTSFFSANQGFILAQRPVCSHFVHALLWASIEPDVTINAATNPQFNQFFKISPFQLWNAFLKKQGVWAKAEAKCVGIQQHGEVYPVTAKDLKDLQVAA